MSYIVLARKWRSRHFNEVVGQEHVARTLCNAIAQSRVAHAFLFCGPRGVGKTSTARILAKALNCAQGPTDTPCYACPSCEEISAGSSVDVFEIDGASNRGVGEIRELREGVHYAPNRDRHKIYIIDEVHMLTTEAFNALLKTLEEPPEHVKFIFATTEPQKIPVTILSRCQRFDFKRIPVRKIVAHLEEICQAEGFNAEPEALSLIARQADGCMRDALSLTDQVISFTSGELTQVQVAEILGVASRRVLLELTGALFSRDVEAALKILDKISMSGHDLNRFANALVGHLRDLTVVKLTGAVSQMTDLTAEEFELARQQTDPLDTSVLHRMFNLAVKAADGMSRSGFPKLIFEMTLVKLAAVEPLLPMELLLKRLEMLESGLLIGEGDDGGGGGGGGYGGGGGAGPGGGGVSSSGHHAISAAAPAGPSASRALPEATLSAPALDARPSARLDAAVMSESVSVPPPRPAAPLPEPVPVPVAVATPAPMPEPVREPAPEPVPAPVPEPEPEPVPTPAHISEPVMEVLRPENAPPEPSNDNIVPFRPPPKEERPEPAEVQAAPAQPLAPAPEPIPLPSTVPAAGAGGVDNPRGQWRRLVDHLKPTAHSVSALLLQARLKRLEPGVINLEFSEDLAPVIDAEKHSSMVAAAAHEALREIWDGQWEVHFDVVEDEDSDQNAERSLADEDDDLLRARRERARQLIDTHALVQHARSLFDPQKSQIILDDDDFYSHNLHG